MAVAGLLVWLAGAPASAAPDAILPVGADLCAGMKAHHVLNDGAPVGCDRLRLVRFAYYGFDGRLHGDGEIMVMDAVAEHALRIFATLRARKFPIARAKLMDAYDGDDDASMRDDNTSAFNDRKVVGGTKISLHAYGLAIDLNPVENPFVTRSFGPAFTVDPPAGADYLNRLDKRPGKPPRPGMAEGVVELFARNGFVDWGGTWDNPIDFQHFDVGRALAEELARLPPAEAAQRFERAVAGYRRCLKDCARGDCAPACKSEALSR